MDKEIICIVCPKSCRVKVFLSDSEYKTIGNNCKKGNKYAVNEAINPKRIFTTIVPIINDVFKVVSVKSSKPIKKEDWKKAKNITKKLKLSAPLNIGQVIINNFLEKGIDLVSTKNIDESKIMESSNLKKLK